MYEEGHRMWLRLYCGLAPKAGLNIGRSNASGKVLSCSPHSTRTTHMHVHTYLTHSTWLHALGRRRVWAEERIGLSESNPLCRGNISEKLHQKKQMNFSCGDGQSTRGVWFRYCWQQPWPSSLYTPTQEQNFLGCSLLYLQVPVHCLVLSK